MVDQPLTRLSSATRARALERYGLLQPFLEAGVPLAQVARTQPRALRTLRTWVARYRRHGLAGLARAPRRLSPALQQLIEGLALKRPPPTAAQIHRQLAGIAPEHGWLVPSYRAVAAVVQRLDPALVTLAHAGAAA